MSTREPIAHEPSRVVALTFDDGPGPSTEALLDALARNGARATFFLVGKSLRGNALAGDAERAQRIAERAVREGHLLGNHSETHAREPIAADELAREFRAMDGSIRDIYRRAGVPAPARIPCRLPYGPLVREGGAQDARLEALAAVGRTHQHWTKIFGDWQPETDPDALTRELIAHVEDHWARGLLPVPVLHDAGTRERSNGFDRSATVTAVARACEVLRARGARFVTTAELDA